jgi:DNA polymerase III delta subunit
MTEVHSHENMALENNFELEALEMALVSEYANRATSNVHVNFYANKVSKGEELDTAEKADKDFWERNLVKIEERIEFIKGELSSLST